MRVVAGEYGGRPLKALPGDNTRPTTDKVKESIFNRIGPYFDGGLVLDLFAGSGGLAIEAISRGCEHAICVDKNYQAISVIKENIKMTKEEAKFTVYKGEANRMLERFSNEGQVFDYLFLDPPYAKQEIVSQIEKMLELKIINQGAVIVCEVDRKVDLPDEIPGLNLWKRQKYGTTEVVIYEREREDD